MKALIVDDEKHVRDAIRYFIPWDAYGIESVLEAENGEEAVALIRAELPAVIFTDMKMPIMGGVQLLAWIREHAPRSKTIVVSGYHDFEYVQPTIVYGGMDYLLKPLNSKQLIAAAERAVRTWRLEEEERKRELDREMEVNAMRPLYWDRVLSDLVSGRHSYRESADELEREFGLQPGAKQAAAALIPLQPPHPRLAERFKGDVQLLAFALTNVCNEVLAERRAGRAFRYWGTGLDIGILLWKGAERAGDCLGGLVDALERTYGVRLAVGAGTAVAFPDGIAQSFEEAQQAARQCGAGESDGAVHYFAAHKDSQLVHDIRTFLDANYHREVSLQDIAERFHLSRENVSRKFKQVTGENLSDYVATLRIEKAKQLLANPSVRLSQIAEMVGIQDEKYFSRVFKKMTGLSPREYRKR